MVADYLGKNCSFGLQCASLTFIKFCVCHFFPFDIEGGIWDVTVLIPDHCLSIYFAVTDGVSSGSY